MGIDADELKTAVIVSCSDPRLADATAFIYEQFKQLLGVTRIIPLPRPGVVGIYLHPDEGAIVRQIALEAEIGIHLQVHQPTTIVIAAHHDCLGHPGDDEHQEHSAREAANILGSRLQQRFGFSGEVRAAMLELRPNPGWKVNILVPD